MSASHEARVQLAGPENDQRHQLVEIRAGALDAYGAAHHRGPAVATDGVVCFQHFTSRSTVLLRDRDAHAAPVLLKTATRIEALFCCQFLALLLAALIEREVRNSMARVALNSIELYPEQRSCRAPSTERILEIFATLTRHQLHDNDRLIQTFQPELTTQQRQVLDLLGLPQSAYTQQPQSTRYPARETRNVSSASARTRRTDPPLTPPADAKALLRRSEARPGRLTDPVTRL